MKRCACPCERPIPGARENQLYVDAKHRQRAYRARVKTALEEAHLPTHLSLRVAGSMGTTSSRNGDAPKPRKQPVRRRVDLRVSYRKAVEAITPHLAYTDLTLARRSAEGILGEILTPKQRDHLREVGDT